MKPQPNRYRKPAPTKAGLRVQLADVLRWRDNLDSIDEASLCRCYAIKPADLRVMVAEERNRRAGRGLG